MTYKPRSLFRVVEDINNQLFLPHIQRPFVWEEDQMIRLFDSLMRNYPIQTLLFWRTNDEIKARKFMDTVDWDADLSDYYDKNKSSAGVEKVFVLDGQQRLQTLYAIFRGGIIGKSSSGQLDAYFDLTSGKSATDEGLMYPMIFSKDALDLPNYRIANLLSKDNQKNPEELADQINETLDATSTEDKAEQKGPRKACTAECQSINFVTSGGKVFLGSGARWRCQRV